MCTLTFWAHRVPPRPILPRISKWLRRWSASPGGNASAEPNPAVYICPGDIAGLAFGWEALERRRGRRDANEL